MTIQSLIVLALACGACMAGASFAAEPSPSAAASAPAADATSTAPAAPPSPLEVAQRERPGLQWQADSELEGDFDCSGQPSTVLLGSSKTEVMLAVFPRRDGAAPVWLTFPAREIDPATAMLTAEDLDFDPVRYVREYGPTPSGLEPSLSCEGLDLTDAAPHSVHVYWDRKKHRYADWRQ